MSEELRSIEVQIKVDTNKRMRVYGIDAEGLDDALEQFRELIDDLRW